MQRRAFLMRAGAGVAATAVARPAIAQTGAPVRWRLATSWPKSLDTLYGSVEAMCQRVGQLTDRKFQIQSFAGGEIVPPLQVWDATQNGTVECGHTLTSFNIGKNPAVAFDSGLAFGLNTRQQQAWMNYGGGLELIRALFKKDGILPIPCGNVGVQMGGFYRKEIDAAEWIGPYDDEKLGLHKVAKYYYYPGWWEGSAQVTLLVNLQHWEALPESYRVALEAACAETTVLMMAKYDTRNPEALRRLVAAGVQLRQFPRPVLDACYKAAFETYDELAAKNPDFKLIYESWQKFLADSNLWFRIAENTLDNYRFAMSAQPR